MLNRIFLGEVVVVHSYGAFVKIPGSNSQGLVHRSQISSAPVEDAAEVLQKNEKVWCKVIAITDDKKISLSMKVVDQGSGRDLDPNGVQISLDEKSRKSRVGIGEQKAITLEAVLNTTCVKCGVQGHLAKNCFKTPEGKIYDLIPEPEQEKKIFGTKDDQRRRVIESGMEVGQSSKTKKKKSKEKKKRKKRKRSDSSSSNADSKTRPMSEKRSKKRKKSSSSD